MTFKVTCRDRARGGSESWPEGITWWPFPGLLGTRYHNQHCDQMPQEDGDRVTNLCVYTAMDWGPSEIKLLFQGWHDFLPLPTPTEPLPWRAGTQVKQAREEVISPLTSIQKVQGFTLTCSSHLPLPSSPLRMLARPRHHCRGS